MNIRHVGFEVLEVFGLSASEQDHNEPLKKIR